MPEAKQALKDGADVNWVFPGTLSAIIDARQPSPKGRKLTVSGMRSSERRRPAQSRQRASTSLNRAASHLLSSVCSRERLTVLSPSLQSTPTARCTTVDGTSLGF